MRFFRTAAAFRKWLAKNFAGAKELVVGFYKTGSGRAGMTYAEALDEALSYGWIDGLRRGIDEETWSIRFTPRKKDSIWSKVNLRHVERLKQAGRMTAPGLAALAARDPSQTGVYSFENAPKEFAPELLTKFKTSERAWAWFSAQAPWYRRTATFWVMSAKKEETRQRRLAQLVATSAKGRKAPPFPE